MLLKAYGALNLKAVSPNLVFTWRTFYYHYCVLNSDSVAISRADIWWHVAEAIGRHVSQLKLPTQLFYIEFKDDRNNSHQ